MAANTCPCRSCRRLRSFDLFYDQRQKIAACGSSYRLELWLVILYTILCETRSKGSRTRHDRPC
ncbi:hypothetical protein C2E19_11515 [Pseudomonas sp. DTU12.3]|nr:hypothetical protein C2E19_11515 [Pseudomonas sp. DTU12.3]